MSSNDKSIQVGDLCRVVSGLAGDQSPNIGLIVKITRYVGYRDTQVPGILAADGYQEPW
jgi:hypothetical protein